MTTSRILAALLTVTVAACQAEPKASVPAEVAVTRGDRMTIPAGENQRRNDLRVFNERYAKSRLAAWTIRGSAAGPQCDVLFVNVALILDDSMIEALHYGAGTYNVFDGGVQQFHRNRGFRGVAYKDASGKVWAYGALTQREAEALRVCY